MGDIAGENKKGYILSMLGVYLMVLYIIGVALTLILLGYEDNLTFFEVVAGLILILAVGFVYAVVLGKKILEVCEKFYERRKEGSK